MLSPVPMDPVAPRVRPVVDALVRRVMELAPGQDDALVAETSTILLRKIANMPKHLGAGMLALTAVFDASANATAGRPFRDLDAEGQRRHIALWRRAPFCRDLVAFYEKMGVFVFYSLREGE